MAAEEYDEEEVRDGVRALNTESEQNRWYLLVWVLVGGLVIFQ